MGKMAHGKMAHGKGKLKDQILIQPIPTNSLEEYRENKGAFFLKEDSVAKNQSLSALLEKKYSLYD